VSTRISSIPFQQLSDHGPVLHFAHANGFPPAAYQHFLKPFLKDHKVIASKFRPLWGTEDYTKVKSWETFADDLIRFLDEQGLSNIIGMGHSLGGVSSLIAAMKRPDLFSKLILLDPVIVDGFKMQLFKYLPIGLKKKVVPIAKISIKRKDTWPSKEVVYESWRTKKVFQGFSDTALKTLVEHAIIPNEKGQVKLAYSKEWETQVYLTAPLIFKKVKAMKTPMIVVRGAAGSVITSQVWEEWQAAQPNNHFINFPNAGHLVPLEHPEPLAKEILKHLNFS